MRVSHCKECNMYFESYQLGHFCPVVNSLVFDCYTIKAAMNIWKAMDENERLQVWEANYDTIYSGKPTFSYAWSFKSFCKAPDYMIARAVNEYENDLWMDIRSDDVHSPNYRPFPLLDWCAIQERSEDSRSKWNSEQEINRIFAVYRKQEEEKLSFLREVNILNAEEEAKEKVREMHNG